MQLPLPPPLPLNRPKWEIDRDWALGMQPVAIYRFYSKIWPDGEIIELDRWHGDILKKALDIGGADKMIRFPNGAIAFLGQRFRRWESWHGDNGDDYDDFTIRFDRPSGNKTEWDKICVAIEHGGFIASFYAYGHANKNDNNFERFRIIRFRETVEAIITGQLHPTLENNPDNSSRFYALPFTTIPSPYFILNYQEQGGRQ